MTRVWLVALLIAGFVACDGHSPEVEPVDAMLRLEAACAAYAAYGCEKNVQCAPPAQEDCESNAVGDCLSDATKYGTGCAADAAAAIEGCTSVLQAMTCDDYCDNTATGSLRCSASCTWICSP